MLEEEDKFENAILYYKSLNLPTFDINDYTFIKVIGRGSFGSAILYEEKKTKEKFVVKKFYSGKLREKSIREILVMNELDHPCICKLLASTISKREINGEVKINLLLPYMPNRDLYNILKQAEKGEINWDITSKMKALYGIAAGMAFMHSHKVIHRDLKPLNILMDENFEIKICDFGTSRFIGDSRNELTYSLGTPYFMAPEIISEHIYDSKADVYSYSIILYMVLYKCNLKSSSYFAILQDVVNGKRLPIDESKFLYGKGLLKLINDCWLGSPARRPSFSEILRIFPKILPDGTDIKAFNEYAKRVNPDFGKDTRPRHNTFSPAKKIISHQTNNKSQNNIPKITPKPDDESDKSQLLANNADDDQDLNNDGNEAPIIDSNIELNIYDNDNENNDDDFQEEIEEEQNHIQNNSLLSMSMEEIHAKSHESGKVKLNPYDIALREAKKGNPKELYDYGLLLYTGYIDESNTTKRDIPQAIEIIKEAAKYQSIDAYYFIGTHYLNGTDGFEINLKEARRYISMAADQGRLLALFYIGFYDQRGLEIYPPGVDPKTVTDTEKYVWPANKEEGFKYAIKAAEKGHAMSSIMVARSYENGVPPSPDSNFSLKKDQFMATKYYKMAADSGDISSMVKFGERAEEGIGMKKKDPQTAIRYLKTASRQGDMHAMFKLGNFYFKGLYGLEKDQKKGADLIKSAADKGLPDAQQMYSKILKRGAVGVTKNKEESLRYEKMWKK